MMSLYPMAGMGSTGMGAGASPMISSQMLAAMQAMQGGAPMGGPMGGAPMGGAPMQPGPMGAAPGATSPMSAYIAAAHPMMNGANGAPQAPVAGPPAPQSMSAAMGGAQQQLAPLLAALAKGQTGVAPGQGAANGIGNMLHGFSWGGIPNQNILAALAQQAGGNIGAGAAGL